MNTKLQFMVCSMSRVRGKVNSTDSVRALNRIWFMKLAEILKNSLGGSSAGMVSVAKVLLVSCVLVGFTGSIQAHAFSFDSMVESIGKNLKKLGEDVLHDRVNPSSKKPSKPGVAQQPGPTASQPGYNHDRQMVAEAQRQLTQLGYNTGIADGRYGKKTRFAIRAFQRDRGFPARGNVTPHLLTQLSQTIRRSQGGRPGKEARAHQSSGASYARTITQPSGGGVVAQVPSSAASGQTETAEPSLTASASTGSQSQGSGMIAQPPGGGLIAPVLGGGLVAPAQGGGQISSTEGTIRSQSSLTTDNTEKALPIGDTLDPLEPEGVVIGMDGSQAWPMLKQKGYKQIGRCKFYQGRGSIRLSARYCKKGETIRQINYIADDVKVANSMLDVVARMKKRIGAEPTKCNRLTENEADCRWESPPSAPLVQRVYLVASKTNLSLEITAVADLDKRVTLPPPPPSTRKTQWWDRELAARTRSPLKFNNQNAQLTPDERGKIRGEAKTVYDYCKGRGLFASFHDCGCVSQQFLDKRAQEVAGWHKPQDQDETVDGFLSSDGKIINGTVYRRLIFSREGRAQRKKVQKVRRKLKRKKAFLTGNVDQNSLIGMADKVAGVCPNKAGTAKYGYRSCVSQFEYRLQDNFETFCTCYGDRFSKFYMRDARSFMPNITSKQSAALTACSEEISPNPLNHD